MAALQGNDIAFVAAQLTQAWAATQTEVRSTATVMDKYREFLVMVANQAMPARAAGEHGFSFG